MPTTPLFDKTGSEAGTIDLPDALFAAPVNTAVMHQAVVAQMAGRRIGTAKVKTRSEVRGGGRKPYRQKGTGRARQGTRSAPHYKGGGVVFGPTPRQYDKRMPKRMRRLALVGALTSKFDDGVMQDSGGGENILFLVKAAVGVLVWPEPDSCGGDQGRAGEGKYQH